MRVSRDKVMHWSHLIVNALEHSEEITWLVDKNTLRMEIANFMIGELQTEEAVDQEVRRILKSFKRTISEGSREWDIMYQKTFEEQMKKHGRISS